MTGKKGTAETGTPVTIRPELAHLAVPIDSVTPWPGNPRQGDRPKITASLLEHGQFAALLIQDSTGWVVKGNNTLACMAELGATEVAVQRLDLTDERARQILAIDNRSSDDATYDSAALAALLVEMDTLVGTGWKPDELDALLRSSDHLGNQATAFLDDVLTDVPPLAVAAPADPVAAAAAPQPAEVTQLVTPTPATPGGPTPPVVEYVTMSWTCLADQRDTVRAAIRRAQVAGGLATAAEGLVAMSQHYLAATGSTE